MSESKSRGSRPDLPTKGEVVDMLRAEDAAIKAANNGAPVEEKNNTKAKEESLARLIAKSMMFVINKMKQCGQLNFNESSAVAFVETCLAFGNVSEYQTVVKAPDGIDYPIRDYLIDAHLVGLIPPISVTHDDVDVLYAVDFMHHDKSLKVRMNPAEFAMFQHALLGARKMSFVGSEVAPKKVYLSAVKDMSNGKSIHCDNLATVKTLPVTLKNPEAFAMDSYFNVPIGTYLTQFMYNILS